MKIKIKKNNNNNYNDKNVISYLPNDETCKFKLMKNDICNI